MRRSFPFFFFAGTAALVFAACSDSNEGSSGPGDDAGSGGDDAGSGGKAAAGGKSSSGGAGSGGKTAAGGGSSSGGADAGAGDGGSDAGAGGSDADAGDPWAGCPSSDDYAGQPAWPHELEVTDGAVYCSTFDESRTITIEVDGGFETYPDWKAELAAKAQLRIAPGSYPLPGADRAGLSLPVCLRTSAAGTTIPVTSGDVTYATSVFEQTTRYEYRFVSPLEVAPDGSALEIDFSRSVTGAAAPSFLLDGTEVDLADAQESSHSMAICPPGNECFGRALRFDSCTHATSTLHTHVVTLGGDAGTITFELRIGQSFASTEPAAYVRAHGTFKGTAFDQRDYWKLVYHPVHHHFARNFAVLFDAPIEGACGVKVENLEPFEDNYVEDVAETVTCTIDTIESIGVKSHVHTREQ